MQSDIEQIAQKQEVRYQGAVAGKRRDFKPNKQLPGAGFLSECTDTGGTELFKICHSSVVSVVHLLSEDNIEDG